MSKNQDFIVEKKGEKRILRRILGATIKEPDILRIQFDNTAGGYDEDDVYEAREQYGENIITQAKKDSLFHDIFWSFINPFSGILIVLAIVSSITKDYSAVYIITTMILLSGIIRFTQEYRSIKASNQLNEMVETTVLTKRTMIDNDNEKIYSKKLEIPLDEIVVGDIVYLNAGDMIPADIRILSAKDLFIDQATLTGESLIVEKFADPLNYKPKSPLESNNLAFMGTTVVSGTAKALVLSVGDDTEFGKIAKKLVEKRNTTPFEKGISSVGLTLIKFMAIMVPIVFFINGFRSNDFGSAFLFALSVAVGMTPEMLPMIISANLAKGAFAMSKKKSIVKNLDSTQNFGAMDILCTDKTGTLTQDKIILQYHLDIHGKEDIRVLENAYLNSFYQTGLKNLMDISIIDVANQEKIAGKMNIFKKIDEIPFDFKRRMMSVAVKEKNNDTFLITKGAVEEMLLISKYAEYKGKIKPITPSIKREILKNVKELNEDGMRVLAIARKKYLNKKKIFTKSDEKNMILIGYLAFLDPPKESTKEAIEKLKTYGVETKVLTGDNDEITKNVCRQVGIDIDDILLGSDIEKMSEKQLKFEVEKVNIFAKLTPDQKVQIIDILKSNGHIVGFLGDGINDAAALKNSDVGISVDTAVDIAKESSDIILMEKDLNVLQTGVIEGRKIYANIIKYIKMTVSSNFGNILSVIVASTFLPFLPMLPLQILMLNLIYDISCIAIPWDNVDISYLRLPRKWDIKSIPKFMFSFGPISSIFDLLTFGFLIFILCPSVFNETHYNLLNSSDQNTFQTMFHTGWFIESLLTQMLVVHMIRTKRIPFIQSRASIHVWILTILGISFGIIVPYIFGHSMGMITMSAKYYIFLFCVLLAYMSLVSIVKAIFIHRNKELL